MIRNEIVQIYAPKTDAELNFIEGRQSVEFHQLTDPDDYYYYLNNYFPEVRQIDDKNFSHLQSNDIPLWKRWQIG